MATLKPCMSSAMLWLGGIGKRACAIWRSTASRSPVAGGRRFEQGHVTDAGHDEGPPTDACRGLC